MEVKAREKGIEREPSELEEKERRESEREINKR